MSNIINIPVSSNAQIALDKNICEAIASSIDSHRLTTAEIVGVLRVIELRMLLDLGGMK